MTVQIDESKSLNKDDFNTLKIIGTGSYGKVVLSQMKSTGDIYAIKQLKKKHLIKKNQVEHTIAERQILVRNLFSLSGIHETSLYY